mmetsp:Transcript_14788/g.31015  ORF Transcript_14788/g.31015 Transcript_14788/m.31015 type:complete len:232 (+) Transcript_14788:1126-1821(+)
MHQHSIHITDFSRNGNACDFSREEINTHKRSHLSIPHHKESSLVVHQPVRSIRKGRILGLQKGVVRNQFHDSIFDYEYSTISRIGHVGDTLFCDHHVVGHSTHGISVQTGHVIRRRIHGIVHKRNCIVGHVQFVHCQATLIHGFEVGQCGIDQWTFVFATVIDFQSHPTSRSDGVGNVNISTGHVVVDVECDDGSGDEGGEEESSIGFVVGDSFRVALGDLPSLGYVSKLW